MTSIGFVDLRLRVLGAALAAASFAWACEEGSDDAAPPPPPPASDARYEGPGPRADAPTEAAVDGATDPCEGRGAITALAGANPRFTFGSPAMVVAPGAVALANPFTGELECGQGSRSSLTLLSDGGHLCTTLDVAAASYSDGGYVGALVDYRLRGPVELARSPLTAHRDYGGTRGTRGSVLVDAGGPFLPRFVAHFGARGHVGGALADGGGVFGTYDVEAALRVGSGGAMATTYADPRLVSLDAMARLPDGAVWASGRTTDGHGALVRFGPDGAPDPSVGAAGLVLVQASGDVLATTVAATPEGGALVALVSRGGAQRVRRVDARGVPLTTYGVGGVVEGPAFGAPVHEGRAQVVLEPATGAARFVEASLAAVQGRPSRLRVVRRRADGSTDEGAVRAAPEGVDIAVSPGTPHVLLGASEDVALCRGTIALALLIDDESHNGLGGGWIGTVAP